MYIMIFIIPTFIYIVYNKNTATMFQSGIMHLQWIWKTKKFKK